ncbi:class I SAM-dependent methyltransferase [Pelagicoccus sp. SDUM812005]|uniref:class I SAM-dependent methyltransferase n=1 Tax=Pelagicoccus sp. SDUM812005 TaxID=3041257 RepID=UPI0028108CB3|nr:class I SAM-dependent methyltransferase [Pelagicoccus sp. SDUM812005]MDQ8180459.1 class I SAM-dependent methyltransferase [Pelagicoccus sp. SDUM812005]
MSQNLFELQSIYFFGRPYAELLKCFGLTEEALVGRSVLECPSGPSSFVVEANARGIDAVGVDPLFYRSPQAIRDLAQADFRVMFDRVKAASDKFVKRTYASVEEAERIRRDGLERFLADYSIGKALGRYREGSLPYLDFEDRSFDVALCGHLLFIYADMLDLEFHRAAFRELCRVAREEVRIHPIVDNGSDRYPHLDELRQLADSLGFDSRIQDVDHEFFTGTNRTLVLRRR